VVSVADGRRPSA
jgi:hypothetical protein